MLKGVGSIKLLLANPYLFIYVMRDLFAWARRSSSMSSRLREYREIFAAYLETVSTKKRKEKRGKSSQSSRKFSGRSGDSDSEDSAGSSSSSSGSDSSGSGNNEASIMFQQVLGFPPWCSLFGTLCALVQRQRTTASTGSIKNWSRFRFRPRRRWRWERHQLR